MIRAALEQKKWTTALPLVRELLPRPGTVAEINQRLVWLLTIGDQALQEGNRVEVLRIVAEVQPYLQSAGEMAHSFEMLGRKAGR
jgi:hypothetical protein